MTMTSNGVPISHLGDLPTAGHHQSHGLYPSGSWWVLVGNKGMTGHRWFPHVEHGAGKVVLFT
jgi:hypothetical protein